MKTKKSGMIILHEEVWQVKQILLGIKESMESDGEVNQDMVYRVATIACDVLEQIENRPKHYIQITAEVMSENDI